MMKRTVLHTGLIGSLLCKVCVYVEGLRCYLQRFLLQFIFLASVAQTFTSVQTGPWENGATWGNNSPGQKGVDFPANNDNVIISSATTVSQSKKTARPTRLVIQSNGELESNNSIGVRGAYVNDGIHSGISTIEMLNFSDSIAGSGSITNTGLFFYKIS